MRLPSPFKPKSAHSSATSLDDELSRLRGESGWGYLFFTAGFALLAFMEWYGYFFGLPQFPRPFALATILCAAATFVQFVRLRGRSGGSLGGEAERRLDQSFGELQSLGASVFHEVPGDGFTLQHVVISDRGVIVVETKTWSRPSRRASVTFSGDQLLIDGRKPRRDPLLLVRAEIQWLSNLLEQLTGDALPVRGVLVLPGWLTDRAPQVIRRDVWVLEPARWRISSRRSPSGWRHRKCSAR